MKKLSLALVTLVLMFTAGCGKKAYYPAKELSPAENMEAIEYYKELLSNTGYFTEDLVFQIYKTGVTLYEVDKAGKALDSYSLDGDIREDIVVSSHDDYYDYHQFNYTFSLDDDVITGTRVFDCDVLKDAPFLDEVKRHLNKTGYPEAEFDVKRGDSYPDDTKYYVYYGKYLVEGDLKDDIIDYVFNQNSGHKSHYTFKESGKNTLSYKTVEVEQEEQDIIDDNKG